MISVVISLYNKAHTIERTLTSVLNQEFNDFEVLIVNDGSTDNGVEIINAFTQDSRVRIINQQNQGVCEARNRGVKESRFEYIAFLDGDDEWFPKYLLKMKEAIEKFPNSGMYCCAGVYKEKPEEILDYRIAKKYKNKILEINYFENPHVFSHTSATIVSKKEFNKTGGFQQGMGINEDFALFYALGITSRVIYIGFPLSCYYGNIVGQVTADKKKQDSNLLGVVNRINYVYAIWETNKDNKLFLIFLKYELRHMIITELKKSNYSRLNIITNNLNENILRYFKISEIKLFKKESLRNLAIIYILITKILWRCNGFPKT